MKKLFCSITLKNIMVHYQPIKLIYLITQYGKDEIVAFGSPNRLN